MIQSCSSKVAIVNNLIHTHTSWDWECQWQCYLEWAIQRYQGSHPCGLVRVVGQGQLNLLFVSQYWSDIYIIPLSSQGLLGMTSGPIKWNGLFTSIHTKAERDWLIGGQLKIELLHIVVHKLLHLLYYPYWNSKCKVETHWQLEACTGSYVVLATYSTTCSDVHCLSATVDHMYA